jgi:hypothetical protein
MAREQKEHDDDLEPLVVLRRHLALRRDSFVCPRAARSKTQALVQSSRGAIGDSTR